MRVSYEKQSHFSRRPDSPNYNRVVPHNRVASNCAAEAEDKGYRVGQELFYMEASMRKLLILAMLVLFAAGHAWADCAWVLVENKTYPEQLASTPAVAIIPNSYYESRRNV